MAIVFYALHTDKNGVISENHNASDVHYTA